MPIDESTPLMPVNPYGETKLAIERALHWYGNAYGLRSVSLRYFNAAGASPDGDAGEDHEPETHLIPLAIRAALDDTCPIDVYGTDYPTADGTAIRDYIHVSDLADAHVRALSYLAEGGASTALNLGTGSGHSVHEVIAAVERVTGRQVARRHAARRPGDPAGPGRRCNALGVAAWLVAAPLRHRHDRAHRIGLAGQGRSASAGEVGGEGRLNHYTKERS